MIKRTLCAALVCLLLTLWAAGSAVHGMAKDEKLLLDCFDRYAQTAHLGVDKSAYPQFALQLSAFFRHETDDPNSSAHPFHDYETVHLFDVRSLMDGISLTANICLMLSAVTAFALFLMYRRKRFSFLWGFILFLGAALGVIVYALADFNAVFTLLHKLLFTNELWLLNPSTDLLIALMPEKMFIHLALRVLWRVLALFALFTVLSLLIKKYKRGTDK